MMGRYLELKTKQTEEELAEQERAKAQAEGTDFSIKNCNVVLATMEDLSCEEREDAYDVFKDVQNREIFMTADPTSRLIWLKKKIDLISGGFMLLLINRGDQCLFTQLSCKDGSKCMTCVNWLLVIGLSFCELFLY